jgi:hypothetical protein
MFGRPPTIRIFGKSGKTEKVTYILPIFATVVLASWATEAAGQTPIPLGQGSTGPPAATAPVRVRPSEPRQAPAESNSGDALLQQVVAAVDAQRSIAAKVRHKVDLGGTTIFGSGVYLQQGRGPGRLLRFELKFQTTPQTTSIQEICDGASLWIHDDLAGDNGLGRVDMARLRRARPKTPAAQVVDTWLALGGLPKVLLGIEGAFRFAAATPSNLDDLSVWSLEGQWKPARLAAMLPGQKAAIEAGGEVNLTKLSPNVPDRVMLYVGRDDLFPYRIEYWRSKTDKKGAKIAGSNLLLVMEFYEVQLGMPIDPRQFRFAPGDQPPVDRTSGYLDRLGLEEIVVPEARQKPPVRR